MKAAMSAALLLSACAALPPPPVATPNDRPPLPFRSCLPTPPPLPPVRTIETLKRDGEELRRVLLDCQERMRRNVEAYDAATRE